MNDDKGFKREDYEFYLDSKRPKAAVVSGPESLQKPVSIDRELARDRSVSSTKKGVPATRKKKQVSNDKQKRLIAVVATVLVGSGIAIGAFATNQVQDFKERSDTYDAMIATVQRELGDALDSKEERALAYDAIASSFGLDLSDNQDSDYIIYMTEHSFPDEDADFVVMGDLAGCDDYTTLCYQHGYTRATSDTGDRIPDMNVYYNYMQAETERVIDHLQDAEKEVTK